MAKIISEMCPAQTEAAPSISSSIKSEDSEAVTPGIGKWELLFSADGLAQFLANLNKLCRWLLPQPKGG